jgi:hypothetical protein
MAAIPPLAEQELINRVYDAIKAEKADKDLYLGRLGSSFIGRDCFRQTWLSWRAFASAEFDGRMYRLFETGHLQEDRIISDLRRAGFTVFDRDAEGRQFEFVDDTGHFIVKVDGVLKGFPDDPDTPYVLELKTHNKNSFSALQKHGVKASKPEHYTQVQAGMMLGGFLQAAYIALCKDDEKLHVERIQADPAEFERIQKTIETLVSATLKPAGISDDGSSFGCKFCDMKGVCTGAVKPVKTCRSCRQCIPDEKGEWFCLKHVHLLTKEQQRTACGEYEAY